MLLSSHPLTRVFCSLLHPCSVVARYAVADLQLPAPDREQLGQAARDVLALGSAPQSLQRAVAEAAAEANAEPPVSVDALAHSAPYHGLLLAVARLVDAVLRGALVAPPSSSPSSSSASS